MSAPLAKGLRRATAVALIAAALWPGVATAGRITLEVTTAVDVSSGLDATLTLTNKGDEAALLVTPKLMFHAEERAGDSLGRLAPGDTHSWRIKLLERRLPLGNYNLLVRIGYQDGNHYPFEVMAASPFSASAQPRPRIAGHLRIPTFKTTAAVTAELALRLPRGRTAEQVDVEVYTPKGLSPGYLKRRVSLDEARKGRLSIAMRNDTLLPGTTLNVYALVTPVGESPPQTDAIQGRVTVGVPEQRVTRQSFTGALAVALAVLALGYVVSGVGPSSNATGEPWAGLVEWSAVGGTVALILYHYPWDHLLAVTTTSGGDMASLYYPTVLMAEEILPSGRLTGWTMGNYAGFPVFHFYSTLPFVLIALLGEVMPMQVAFKLVTLLGPTMLPVAAAYLMRSIGYRRGGAAIAAASTLPFLFQQGNSMWGGNIPSVLAGEFCHSIGISLSLVFIGAMLRTSRGELSWVWCALLLAAIGLSHTFAFIAALWYALYFLWPRRDAARLWAVALPVFGVAGLMLCFWGLPLPARLKFTTEWSVIWNIKSWVEVVPRPLWPALALTGADLVLLCVGLVSRAVVRLGPGPRAAAICEGLARLKPFRAEREGLFLFVLAGMTLLYFVTPAIGFPDIRFIPIGQIFLGLAAADFLYWLASLVGQRLLVSVCVLLGALAWTESHLGYVPAWLNWNYSGYERKATWDTFKEINDHLHGDRNDPRVVFEHSQAHNRFGSSRAFENLPFFSGRSTLEGVFHQASPNSPYVFYLQSEASEKTSGPFRQYSYARLDPEKALPHLRMYNVGELVVVSDKAKEAYEAHPSYTRTFSRGGYQVYGVEGGDTGYVVPAANEPVLYDGPDWKLALYRWFKHPDLLDVPLVPADLLSERERAEFVKRTDSVRRIPRSPLDGACEVRSNLEQYRIRFETDCPGRPHIVKVSFFPRWRATDGSPVQLVSPGFMLVYPDRRHFELVYGRNAIDWIGILLSSLGLALAVACLLRPSLGARFKERSMAALEPLAGAWERWRFPIAVVLVAAGVAAATATRLTLRAPDKAYREAQQAYRERRFEDAVRMFEEITAEDIDTFRQATSLFELGVSHHELGHHATAVHVLQRLLFEFPNINYGAGARFHLARAFKGLDLNDEAREQARLLQTEPGSDGWVARLKQQHPDLLD